VRGNVLGLSDSLKLQAQAESLLQKAVKLTPQSAEGHYLLGQLAMQQSRLKMQKQNCHSPCDRILIGAKRILHCPLSTEGWDGPTMRPRNLHSIRT